jgi:hypothetical protein
MTARGAGWTDVVASRTPTRPVRGLGPVRAIRFLPVLRERALYRGGGVLGDAVVPALLVPVAAEALVPLAAAPPEAIAPAIIVAPSRLEILIGSRSFRVVVVWGVGSILSPAVNAGRRRT